MEPDPHHFENTINRANKSINRSFLNLAKIFRVEELAVSAMEDENSIIAITEPEAILALRRESRQLLTVIRAISFYMLVLTTAYFVQAILCLKQLDLHDFEANFDSKKYADEIYTYSVEFEKMKIIHGITLATI